MKKFPTYKQTESKDCGPTCLKIIAKHYGKTLSISQIRQISETTRKGSSLLNLSVATETVGFRSLGVKLTLENIL
ncbi:cysteine peptidase family C39 domain-containing protein [uncultured Olleya sp.]|uniref:cysteine peptidase family C39 domain-containing protein n=1 Tax=uncultured Olleya sp. TaxID=757243 RepID=UPI0025940D8C|nr:cysteine peptidase family C39 domain-containing protein [uncultured Olleya sp.]